MSEFVSRELSGCETLIMKAVWDAEEDIALQELIEVLRVRFNKDYARTTVATFLTRLIDKGYVTTYRKGRVSYTHAIKDEAEFKQRLLREELSFWFQGSEAALLSALCEGKTFTQEEIDHMRVVVDSLSIRKE